MIEAMEMRQLRYFLAVAQDLHFTRAAERLRVAQPALSLQIRQLEAELQVKLFERIKHRVELTAAGQAFRNSARFALEQLERASRDAKLLAEGQAGSVSIGFVSSAALSVLPRILRGFAKEVPAAVVELRELDPSEQIDGLRKGTLDLGVMHALVEATDLQTTTLAREDLLAALPRRHPAAQKAKVSIADLASDTFLVPKSHQFGGLHEIVLAACFKAGFVPGKIQSTRLLQTALCLVGAGMGVALLPAPFRDKVQVSGVIYRPLEEKVQVDLVAVWMRTNHAPLLNRLQTHFPRPKHEPAAPNLQVQQAVPHRRG